MDPLIASQLAFDDLDVVPDLDEIATIATRKVVENPHARAALEKSSDDRRADETASASDQRLEACELRENDAQLGLGIADMRF
jgi:hypothetical protein